MVTIQRHWRGYAARKSLRRQNEAFARLQRHIRARTLRRHEATERRMAENELKFQLVLAHRREQRRRKCELLELIEILPAHQLPAFMERQREQATLTIQTQWRGLRTRRWYARQRQAAVEERAARRIQFAVRQWLARLKKRREQPAFYSRPRGLDGPRREFLFDKIRQHLDSQPVNTKNSFV